MEEKAMAKKAAKKTAKKTAKKCGAEMLLVGSKVKAAVRAKGCNCSAELLEALNCAVYCIVEKAVARCQGNRRMTVKAQDV